MTTINPDEILKATDELQKGEVIGSLTKMIYFYAPAFCIGRVTRVLEGDYAVVEFVAQANEADGTAYPVPHTDLSGKWVALLPSLIAGRTRIEAMQRQNTLGREAS